MNGRICNAVLTTTLGLAILCSTAQLSATDFILSDLNPGLLSGSGITGTANPLTKTITLLDGTTPTFDGTESSLLLNYSVSDLDFSAVGGTTTESVDITLRLDALTENVDGAGFVRLGGSLDNFGIASGDPPNIGANQGDIRNDEREGIAFSFPSIITSNPDLAVTATSFPRVRLQGFGADEQAEIAVDSETPATVTAPPNSFTIPLDPAVDPAFDETWSLRAIPRADGTQTRFTFQDFQVSFLAGPATSSLACDLDGDQDCDQNDIDLLYGNSPTGDDIQTWLDQAADPNNPFTNGENVVYTIGDLNLNGEVNSVDLGALLNNFGDVGASPTAGVTWDGGDLNADGIVNSVDLGGLLNEFGFTSPASLSAVPEPHPTTVLGVLLMLAIPMFRRRIR